MKKARECRLALKSQRKDLRNMSEYKDSKTSDTLRCTENFNVVGRVPLLYSFHLFGSCIEVYPVYRPWRGMAIR